MPPYLIRVPAAQPSVRLPHGSLTAPPCSTSTADVSMLLRRLRAVATCASLWAVAWALLGVTFRMLWPTEAGLDFPTLKMLAWTGVSWILPGLIGGAVFALHLAFARRPAPEDLSMRRLAFDGAMGATIIPIIALGTQSLMSGRSYLGVLPLIAQYAIAGGLCATGSFFLARRAPDALDAAWQAELGASNLTNAEADKRSIVGARSARTLI